MSEVFRAIFPSIAIRSLHSDCCLSPRLFWLQVFCFRKSRCIRDSLENQQLSNKNVKCKLKWHQWCLFKCGCVQKKWLWIINVYSCCIKNVFYHVVSKIECFHISRLKNRRIEPSTSSTSSLIRLIRPCCVCQLHCAEVCVCCGIFV